MRHFIIYFFITLLSLGFMVQNVEAARFGGGRSFGVQRSHSSLFSQRTPHQSSSAFGQRSPQGIKWGSVLGGLLAGGLLASLFMGHGIGSGIIAWLILGSLIFFVFGFLRKRMQPSTQSYSFQNMASNASSYVNAAQGGSPFVNQPTGFEAEEFLRAAKVIFIRLQAAYDQKNLHDILTFTAPDVFAEIKMQLDEQGNEPNKTDVEKLNAELLDASKQVHETIASVRFTGFIKENNAPTSSLDEIWHFRQDINNNAWIVVGIQQKIVAPN
jgi:predicted lipid-binding transport protein (Tim44 family)